MKTRPDARSPWGQRMWLDDAEFEDIMDEIRSRAGATTLPEGEGIDVDEILLRVYGIDPDYCDLDAGLLGRTLFFPDGRLIVQISRDLAEGARRDPVIRRRLRSTTAHECAHIPLHAHLHLAPASGTLFPEVPPPEVRTMCRTEAIDQPRRVLASDWTEYQANRGMSALLLPNHMVRARTAATLARMGLADMRAALRAGLGEDVIREISLVFDVSFEMAFYRLEVLGILPRAGQPELDLR